MKPALAKKLLSLMGWTTIGEVVPERNAVILEAPHTSIWDFVIGYLYYQSKGEKLIIMVKKEFFFWPLGSLLKALGCFPIDRKSPARSVIATVNELKKDHGRNFHMAMCPEGTRKAIAEWKTGYHTIASKSGAPLYLSMVDWGHKKVGIFGRYELTGNAREDTAKIQTIYRQQNVSGKHPENFIA